MNIEDIVNNIETWIKDENDPKIKATRDIQYDGKNQPFLLKIIYSYPSADLPISIFKPLTYKNKISIYSGVRLDEEQKESFHALRTESKNEIISEWSRGLLFMNLPARLYYDKDNKFSEIIIQEFIYSDGITRDRVMNSILKISNAYGFIIATFKKYNIMQKGFDPSDLI